VAQIEERYHQAVDQTRATALEAADTAASVVSTEPCWPLQRLCLARQRGGSAVDPASCIQSMLTA
jgi:hypothetical protein